MPSKVPEFAVYYASVQEHLKHNEGCFEQLMDNSRVEQIVEFWWNYISKDCNDYFTKRIPVIAKGKDWYEQSRKMKAGCFTAVIFDNWDRINASIVRNPTKECVPKSDKKDIKKK